LAQVLLDDVVIGLVPEKSHMWALGFAVGVLAFFIFLTALAIGHRNSTVYPQDDQHLASFHSDQCERPVDQGWMAEVQNTLSNVGYALAGMLILLRVRSWAGHLLGLNLLLLSFMSALYHATLTETPQKLDVAWVYAALLALQVYASFVHVQAENPFRVSPGIWIGCGCGWVVLAAILLFGFHAKEFVGLVCLTVFVATAEALCFLSRKAAPVLAWVLAPALLLGIPVFGYLIKDTFNWDSDAVFPILTVLLIMQLALIFASTNALKWELVGWELLPIVLTLAFGLFFRLADGYGTNSLGFVDRKLLCHPDWWFFQAHANWHLLSAAALLLSYDLLVQFQRRSGDQALDRTVIFPERSAYG
jgi:hypothetical protein